MNSGWTAQYRAYHKKGWTALHLACKRGRLEDVRALLKAEDVVVDARASDGAAAFAIAFARGHLKIARALLAAGADVEQKVKGRRPALHVACAKRNVNMAKLLVVEFKADVQR